MHDFDTRINLYEDKNTQLTINTHTNNRRQGVVKCKTAGGMGSRRVDFEGDGMCC